MNQHVLIYGFGPYAHYRHNITCDIIEQLRIKNIAQTTIFETRFSRNMFEEAFNYYRPKVVIGLGQDSRAKKIRIERRARNWRKGLVSPGRAISKAGPEDHYVSLKVSSNDASTITYNAGAYVCNYSMYLMCELCDKIDSKFAFLHVPVKIDVELATRFIEQTVRCNTHAG